MTKLICTTMFGACLLFAPALAAAQPRHDRGDHEGGDHEGGRQGRIVQRMERMAERLGLSEAQHAQVRTILLDTRARAQAMRQSTERGTPARQQARRQLMEDTQQRIARILTPAQRTQLEQMRAQRREHMRERCREFEQNAPAAPGAAH